MSNNWTDAAKKQQIMNKSLSKNIVVVGGGFAGLELMKQLGNSDKHRITLVDSNNYNFFPPLIYQVSSGFMEPSAISYPFRKILRELKNVNFRLGSLKQVLPQEALSWTDPVQQCCNRLVTKKPDPHQHSQKQKETWKREVTKVQPIN